MHVILDGYTKLYGIRLIGTAAVTIAYHWGNDEFILAHLSNDGLLKMVKVQIRRGKKDGKITHKWLEGKYDSNPPSRCISQETFQRDCYRGISFPKTHYDVKRLVAIERSGTGHTVILRMTRICQVKGVLNVL